MYGIELPSQFTGNRCLPGSGKTAEDDKHIHTIWASCGFGQRDAKLTLLETHRLAIRFIFFRAYEEVSVRRMLAGGPGLIPLYFKLRVPPVPRIWGPGREWISIGSKKPAV
jgi:hypothetical protein